MYDMGPTRAAYDRLWGAIRSSFPEAPQTLSHSADPWDDWLSPDLFLSQTCSLPYRTRLHAKVQLVGTPDYGVTGRPGYYCSVLLTRRGDTADPTAYFDKRFAFNDMLSQSGWAAPQLLARDHGRTFAATLHTGSHRASAFAVAEDRADLAALDIVTWHLIRDTDPALAGLQEIARTAPTPGLPLITGPKGDPAALFTAVQTAIAALDADDRRATRLRGLVRIPAADYLALPLP